jgi:ketosteroid isomerase-like protein
LLVLAGLAACAHGAASPDTNTHQETPMDTTTRDHAAILETIHTIARGADLRQWDLVRASFATRVELDYGAPELLTPDEIVARWQPLLSAFDSTQHLMRDERVERVDEARARVRSTFQATHHLAGAPGGALWTLSGAYEHELVKQAAGWKVSKMRMIPGASSGNPDLLAQARQRAGLTAPAPDAAPDAADARGRNRRVVRAFFERLEAFDIEGFAALFAEHGTQVMPFSPAGFPRALAGRAAIFNQYRGMPQNFTSMTFPDLVIHDMLDPSRFFVTYRGEIQLRAGGAYNNTYAGVFEIENGQIVAFTEYFDPIVLGQAFGASLQDSFNVHSEGGR